MSKYPILSVCSGKGGVGKSTISFYLAKALSLYNYKVGLIDADIYGPSLHLFFKDLNDKKPAMIDGAIHPALVEDIKFMTGAFYAPGGAFIRAPKATAIVKSFFTQVAWGDIDLLIVDFPPGTGDIALTLFQEICFDAAVVVTTPHTLSVEDASKSAQHIIQSGIDLLGFIENMAFLETAQGVLTPFGQGGGRELESLFTKPLLSKIPLLPQETGSFEEKINNFFDPVIEKIKPLLKCPNSNLNLC